MFENNKMVADMDLIKVLLNNSSISAYEIEAKTGINRMTISNFRNGKSNIDKMPLMTAVKLTNFSINQIKIKASELYDRMVHSNAFDYVISVNKENSVFLKNKSTDNFQSVYNYKDDEYGHHFGVYGDIVGGQVDSRNIPEEKQKEVITDAIVKMLSHGNIVPRKSVF